MATLSPNFDRVPRVSYRQTRTKHESETAVTREMPDQARIGRESTAKPYGRRRKGLGSASFVGLSLVQFLTVLNDNSYRWLVVPIGYALVGPQHKGLILTLGLAGFVIPYILLVAPAAYLADRFSKRRVIGGCMLLQAVILILGIGAILMENTVLIFATLTLMGAQGALLSPARAGTIPETVHADRISRANGVMGMATVLAAVVGSVLGNTLYLWTAPLGKTRWWLSASVLIGISLLGWAVSLLILKKEPADPARPLPRHLFTETRLDLDALRSDRGLMAAASASAFFWFLAALAQVNVYLLGTTILDITQEQVGYLLAILALGVAVGAIVAGLWSGGSIEPGIVPFGAALITLSSFMLYVTTRGRAAHADFYETLFYLFLMGFGSGLYDVPLQSYLQYNSLVTIRGRVLAASNFLAFSAMLFAALLFWVARSVLGESASIIYLAGGVIALIVTTIIVYLIPHQTKRAMLRALSGMWELFRQKPRARL